MIRLNDFRIFTFKKQFFKREEEKRKSYFFFLCDPLKNMKNVDDFHRNKNSIFKVFE